MFSNLIIASYLIGGKFMSKKPVLVALLLVVCVTAVLLTALFRDSLCEFHYQGATNDLRMIFAYEVRR